MEVFYKTYRWKYVSRKPKDCLIICARKQETAEQIIAIENTDNFRILRLVKLFPKKTIYIKEPPYEFEQSEMDIALQRLEKRREYLKKNPNAFRSIAKGKKDG